jgi:hypothetical protein
MTEISLVTVAKSAEVVAGTLYGLGIGWNWTPTPTPPIVLVVRADVPGSRLAGQELPITFALEDSDGRPVPHGEPWVTVSDSPTLPDGQYVGVGVPLWMLVYFPPLDLAPGRYQFRVTCDDAERSYAFSVVAPL